MDYRKLNTLLSEALEIEEQEAMAAGSIGFMARALTMATLPHSKPKTNEFTRTNGSMTMTMLALSKIGLPYGTIPRLLLAWLTTEAVRTKNRELILGDSMSAFMSQLGIVPTGGRWGSIQRVKSQARKLFCSSVYCDYSREYPDGSVNYQALSVNVIEEHNIWWDPKPNQGQKFLWDSIVILSERFYDEIIKNPVPIDMRAITALSKSPMALDIYMWITYRMSYLHRYTVIPWLGLQNQFGAGYPMTARGTRNFKAKFLTSLKKVVVVYPDAKVSAGDRGLILKPSKTHVRKLVRDKTIEFKPPEK